MLFNKEKLINYPKDPGVYLMKDSEGIILYIGKAKNLRDRLKQYFDLSDARAMIPFLTSKIASIETIVTPSEKEALLLENNLIKKHQPKYNALLKDDKMFVSLMINDHHPWPMVKMVRHKGSQKEKGLYFGPYTSTLAAKETFDLLTSIFPLRQCSDQELASRKRPCILYEIKRCIAPCARKCTREDYQLYVNQTIEFLKGHDDHILSSLREKMQEASDSLEFEKAATLLKIIKRVEHVIENKKSLVHSIRVDTDVIGLYREASDVVLVILSFREGKLLSSDHFEFSMIADEDDSLLENFLLQHYDQREKLPKEILLPIVLTHFQTLTDLFKESFDKTIKLLHPEKGEKKELSELGQKNAKVFFSQRMHQEQLQESRLQEMQEKLHLSRFPMKIECFDTSNLSGTSAVAALVTFKNGQKDSSGYRLYHIKSGAIDDYHAMKEILSRRFKKAKINNDLPDLIIIDGGKTHLQLAHQILEELEIASCDLIGLAKENARHDKGLSQEQIFILSQKDPILLPRHSPILFLLQQIRDEAHRRAISLHKTQRRKKLFTSELDNIPGIGPIKKTLLLSHFGSVKNIKLATEKDLQEVKGLSITDIQKIIDYFKI